MTKISARLTMLDRLKWTFAATGTCGLGWLWIAMSRPSADACANLRQITGDVPAGCGPSQLSSATVAGIVVFLVLAVATAIAESWQRAKIAEEGR